jgi:hypothetical protein
MSKERPILFSEYWVRALLAGRKTQTRRAINRDHRWAAGEPYCPHGSIGDGLWVKETWRPVPVVDPAEGVRPEILGCAAIYRADDPDWTGKWLSSRFMFRWASRITLRITDVHVHPVQEISDGDILAEGLATRHCDPDDPGYKWRGLGYESVVESGSMHAPHPGGECWCTRLVPKRLTSYKNALRPARCAWREAWDSINRKPGYSWDENPLVWAISFEVERIKSGTDLGRESETLQCSGFTPPGPPFARGGRDAGAARAKATEGQP